MDFNYPRPLVGREVWDPVRSVSQWPGEVLKGTDVVLDDDVIFLWFLYQWPNYNDSDKLDFRVNSVLFLGLPGYNLDKASDFTVFWSSYEEIMNQKLEENNTHWACRGKKQ